ncbi:MAG: hypothetical protein QOG28_6209 [Trebonia sp.]|nr:hypothetical protein [Trebonia sp.]
MPPGPPPATATTATATADAVRFRRTARGAALRLLAVSALLGALPLLAGCDALGKIGAGAHYPPAKAFTVAGRVTAVVIDGGSGSVDVTGSSRTTVSVSQHASYSGTPPSAAHVLHGTTLTVSYTCPAEIVCGMSYDVQVPGGVAVTVATGAGAVTLTSLAGTVTARADAGLITAVDMRSAVASFKSNAGGVVATFSAAPRSLTATTNVGPVTLTVPGSVGYRLSTHTLVGTSTVTVRRSSGSAHSISASSDLGSISVNPS